MYLLLRILTRAFSRTETKPVDMRPTGYKWGYVYATSAGIASLYISAYGMSLLWSSAADAGGAS